jgi:hypothetical protein
MVPESSHGNADAVLGKLPLHRGPNTVVYRVAQYRTSKAFRVYSGSPNAKEYPTRVRTLAQEPVPQHPGKSHKTNC